MRVCAANGCDRAVHCRGFCGKHYQRFRKHGDVTIGWPEPGTTCIVDGCDRTDMNGRMCSLHYQQLPHVRVRKRQDSAARREWVDSQKRVPCSDCGRTYPAVCMDFDHRDPSQKAFSIGHRATCSKESLSAEIAKCDVVCANCHRLRTHPQKAEAA